MPAYLIADTHVTNPERYEEYKRQVAPLIERFGDAMLRVADILKCLRVIGSRTDLLCWSSLICHH